MIRREGGKDKVEKGTVINKGGIRRRQKEVRRMLQMKRTAIKGEVRRMEVHGEKTKIGRGRRKRAEDMEKRQ